MRARLLVRSGRAVAVTNFRMRDNTLLGELTTLSTTGAQPGRRMLRLPIRSCATRWQRPAGPSISASVSGDRTNPGFGRATSVTFGAQPKPYGTVRFESATGAAWGSYTFSICRQV